MMTVMMMTRRRVAVRGLFLLGHVDLDAHKLARVDDHVKDLVKDATQTEQIVAADRFGIRTQRRHGHVELAHEIRAEKVASV